MTAPTLVTGATGFVGSAVARVLQARGHNLRLMVRAGSDRSNIAEIPAEVVEGDLSQPATFAQAVEGCRYVFHVAADYRLWVPDPAPMMAINVEGTRLLMLAAQAAGVERIVYCSSVAALGLIGDGTISDEETPVNEHSVIGIYKKSKYRGEQEVLRLARDKALPVVIVNPSTPVGPYDIRPTPTGQMILDCAAGRMPAYVDTGVNIVHVDDVAEGHALALERGVIGEKYILGGQNYLLGDLFQMVAEIAGVKPPKIRLPQEVIWPVAVASEWLSRKFGIEPRV
ncbi:hopanoid-associated sugar epimerase, partial [Acetobacter sp.]|uniref:hopanoid-associated sugar epimerase n=1 Tax=Acetobacter sp. TaxID=440 RepID=UPI0039E91381